MFVGLVKVRTSPLFGYTYNKNTLFNNLVSDPEDRCGIGLLSTSNDPFFAACKRHDHNYVLMGAGGGLSRKQVDDELLRDMKVIVQHTGKWWLIPKAYLYYGVARLVGAFYWD